jgi:amidase
MKTAPAMAISSLTSGYGRMPVLHGIDLEVGRNEFVGILGHNGMGKSTLLRTVMGFLPARDGRVVLDDEEITRLKPHDRALRGLAYIPQGRGIFPKLTARENLLLARHDGTAGDNEEALERILTLFPRLVPLLDHEGGSLSGGEQQLLALARGLIDEPWFLLLDEPTEGIQPSIIEEMEETFLKLRKEFGLTILLVEQNFDFISALSDRVLVMERGKLTAEFGRDALADSAQIEAFLGFGAIRRTRANVMHQPREISRIAYPRPATNTPSRETAARAPAGPASGTRPQSMLTSALPVRPAQPEAVMTVRRPSLEQMRSFVSGFGLSRG